MNVLYTMNVHKRESFVIRGRKTWERKKEKFLRDETEQNFNSIFSSHASLEKKNQRKTEEAPKVVEK